MENFLLRSVAPLNVTTAWKLTFRVIYHSSYQMLVILKKLFCLCISGCKSYVIIYTKILWFHTTNPNRLTRPLMKLRNFTNLIIDTSLYTYALYRYTQICFAKQGPMMVFTILVLLRCVVHGYISHETVYWKTSVVKWVVHILYVVLALMKSLKLYAPF